MAPCLDPTPSMNIHVLRLETTDSTNTEAVKHAQAGAAEGLCVLARQQTAGRGRRGRTWVSERDAGLYFSIVLRPALERTALPLITLLAGIAVHDTLADLGIAADIKWVNDLLVGDKKIAGILSEAVPTEPGLAVIVGIGINLTSKNFPDEISETATSIEKVTGRKRTADEVAQLLTGHLSNSYSTLQRSGGPEIIEQWSLRSTYFRGQLVRVAVEEGHIEGITDGLEPDGALRVKTADGSVHIVKAGDVQRLRKV
jgi:BirA family transcriptional regulator, biotin operon repressor / biotin---[acetyl-CoA-carboxylase] ligase